MLVQGEARERHGKVYCWKKFRTGERRMRQLEEETARDTDNWDNSRKHIVKNDNRKLYHPAADVREMQRVHQYEAAEVV